MRLIPLHIKCITECFHLISKYFFKRKREDIKYYRIHGIYNVHGLFPVATYYHVGN